MKFSRFRPHLACPDCRGELKDQDGGLRCPACSADYPIDNDVPILISRRSLEVAESGEKYFGGTDPQESLAGRLRARRWLQLPNPAIRSRRPRLVREVFKREVLEGSGLILNIGSGVHKHYTNPNLLNLDIAHHENVDVVGDGLALPLAGEAFDGVVLDAVIEHVPDPWRIAAEAHRVLKPGGFVLVHAPFLYPYHGAPHDYFRYTDEGLRRVFSAFREEECESDHLPTRALLEILRAYSGIYADGRAASFALRFLTAWTTIPFKLLDYYLQGKSRSQTVVTGFSYLGRKDPAAERRP